MWPLFAAVGLFLLLGLLLVGERVFERGRRRRALPRPRKKQLPPGD
jgi:hypothetical protein